jgi:large subunit ribosomal protein L30e
MLDVEKVIKNTIKKGKVIFGFKQTKESVDNSSAKLVVISKNCPNSEIIKKLADKKKIPTYNSNLDSIDLGLTCGKAFSVSVFSVIDEGGSDILNLVK